MRSQSPSGTAQSSSDASQSARDLSQYSNNNVEFIAGEDHSPPETVPCGYLYAFQRLCQIRDQVILILDTDREPDQPLRDADLQALLFAKRSVG